MKKMRKAALGDKIAPSDLAWDTNSPYVDNRPLLVANQPETRTYTAFYVLHDAEIGLVSDAVLVVWQPSMDFPGR